VIRPESFGKGLDVASTAQDLLDHVVAHWAAVSPGSAEPLPARRLLAAGDPQTIAWDCEQLVVSLQGIGFGPAVDASPAPSPRAGVPLSAQALRHAVLAVDLVRCTPSPDNNGNVAVDVLNAAGLVFMRDCGLLSQAVVTFAGILRSRLSDIASVQCGAVDPIGPTGGFHAAEVTIAITVPELI
jgi:hypothetical protein